MNLPQQSWVKKTVHGEEIHWLTDKEKVTGATVIKESHADSLGFLEKNAIINSAKAIS